MSLIIALETTTTNCSVALSRSGKTIALKEDKSKSYSHAEKLHVFIREVMAKAGCTISDLDAVAVSKGPGSYTGLRIGVSAAKGLSYAADRPLIAIDTLSSMADSAILKREGTISKFIIPMLDARRMEVYTAVFDSKGLCRLNTTAKVLTADSYQKWLDQGRCLFIGNAVEKFKDINSHKNAVFEKALPSAKHMGFKAHEKLKKGDTVDVAYFEPYYLKDFIAQKPKKKG